MTLSPADDSDYRVTIADTVECKTDVLISCSVLGIFRKDNRLKAIRDFCTRQNIRKAYMSNDGISMQLDRDESQQYQGVAVFKYGVVHLTQTKNDRLYVHMFGCIRDVCSSLLLPIETTMETVYMFSLDYKKK